MADIDLLNLQPHKVSRDLRGYSVFFYGDPKTGKTTTAARFPESLLLAFEKGYNAIPGIMAQPINSWAEFRKVLRQLKTEEVKKKFSTIIIDTADIAYDYCTRYICDNAKRTDGGFGVDTVSDIPFGKGYGMISSEYDECLRSILQLDYGLVVISHSDDKVFKDEQGNEYNKIVPTLDKRARNVIARMTDIIGYSRVVKDSEGKNQTRLFIRPNDRYLAGSRFKYTPDSIEFNYQNLVNAIANAIDKQAAEEGNELFTDERSNLFTETKTDYDFDALMSEFETIVNRFIAKGEDEFNTYYAPRITQITDKYLGRGQKVSAMSREQAEALSLIVDDLHELEKTKR